MSSNGLYISNNVDYEVNYIGYDTIIPTFYPQITDK